MKDNITYFAQDFGQEFQCLAPELRALEGKVDLIFSNFCFQWIENKANVVKNMNHLLSKGGKIYINILGLFYLLKAIYIANLASTLSAPTVD